MSRKVFLLVGTKKGAFIFSGDETRSTWTLHGPYCEAWPIHHVVGDPATGTIYAAGGNEWFGPAVWRSKDFGASWTHSSEGLAYGEGETPIKAAWSLACTDGRIFAGVEPAGLFESRDGGDTWRHIEGLSKHPTRSQWMPGGGGLILHTIVPDRADHQRIWVAISTAGVFYSGDGGATWEPRNRGTRTDYMPEGMQYPEVGQCVHSISQAAGGSDRLYQQNHCGMYRSDDGGLSWVSIEKGLPSTFGFPAVAHARNPDTVFLMPLNGDVKGRFVPEGKAAVWRSRSAGAEWEALRQGLPQQNAFFGVLRQAMAVDLLEPAGVYFGTSSGSLYASNCEGDQFQLVAEHLPVITSVETLVV